MKANKPKGSSDSLKKSKLPNLYVNANTGLYYAVSKVNGRRKKRSLKTKDFGEASRRLALCLKTLAEVDTTEKMTLREAVSAAGKTNDPSIKQSTKNYYLGCSEAILECAPEGALNGQLFEVTTRQMRMWQERASIRYSASRVNGQMSLLNRVFNRAKEDHLIAENPMDPIKRLSIVREHRWVPSPDEFESLVQEIRAKGLKLRKGHMGGSRFAEVTADAVELLGYTGLRIKEAERLTWGAVRENTIEVRCQKHERTKNDRMRAIPISPKLRDLLERMRKSAPDTEDETPVMRIKRPTIGLANACERLGFPHLRVHDLRHTFATRCIESGVDVPTVAQWLGHIDGGITLSQRYAQVMPRHSAAQMQKVAF